MATIYYNSTDLLNSSSVMTDNTGAIAETMDYFPFGAIRIDQKASTGPTAFSEQRKYIGQEFDADTGLSYLNARYYNATLGRFVSQDPVFLAIGDNGKIKEITGQELQQYLSDPQALNSYSYANNNPITQSDPNGQSPIKFPNPVESLKMAIIGMQQWLNQQRESMNWSEYSQKNAEAMRDGSIYLGTNSKGQDVQFGAFGMVDAGGGMVANYTIKYGKEIGSKMNEIAKVFQKEDIFVSDHAIRRTAEREVRGITPEKVIDTFKNGSKYLDSKYPDTINYFKNGIRIAVDKITQEIKTVVTQNKMSVDRFTSIK